MAEGVDHFCNNGANGTFSSKNLVLTPPLPDESVGMNNDKKDIHHLLEREHKSVIEQIEPKAPLKPEPAHHSTDSFENTALNIFKRLLSSTDSEEAHNNNVKLNMELGNIVFLTTHRVVKDTEDLDSIVRELSLTQCERKEIMKCSKLEKLEYFSQEDLSVDDPESEFKLFAFYWERSEEAGRIAILKTTILRHQILQEYYLYFMPIQRTSVQLNQALILKILAGLEALSTPVNIRNHIGISIFLIYFPYDI